jgi:hypothetical protein
VTPVNKLQKIGHVEQQLEVIREKMGLEDILEAEFVATNLLVWLLQQDENDIKIFIKAKEAMMPLAILNKAELLEKGR